MTGHSPPQAAAPSGRFFRLPLTAAAALAIAFLAWACAVDVPEGRGTEYARRSLDHPIVIIGLDGADWQVADPLLESGELPNLARLRREGAWGNLRSSRPMLSPLLWTSVTTGKPPDQHGIVDFLVTDPATGNKVPITSTYRRVPALWNIFGSRRLTSAFVAWWATYPAEQVRGEMISDRVAYSLFELASIPENGRGLVHPPSLWSEIQTRVVSPSELSDEEVATLAAIDPGETATARREIEAGGGETSRGRLVHLMKILASTRTYHDIALDAIARGQPDLFGVYYQGIDEVSHRTAHCVEPALDICKPEDRRRFAGSIDAFYRYQDGLVGEILSAIDPGSYVILLSDHGFRNGGDRPRDVAPDVEGKPAMWHRRYGVVLLHGPGIEPGFLDNVTLLDIAPTILRLAGLPLADDMPGRALVDPSTAPPTPEGVASYEFDEEAVANRRPAVTGAGSAGEEEMLENLRSLGYIGGRGDSTPASGLPGGADAGTVTSHGNLGAIHLQNGQFGKAAEEFEAALAISPTYYQALMGLAEAREHEGRYGEALELVTRGMEESRSPGPGVFLRYAGLAAQVGAEREARERLRQVRSEKPKVAEIPTALAILAQRDSRFDEAEKLLLEALEIDPANSEAISRLMWFRERDGDVERLRPFLERALSINPSSVAHRNLLGQVLEKQRDLEGAEREYRRALEIEPDFGPTMANLGSLYARAGRLAEAVAVLSRALEIEPQDLECRVNLGAALGKLGRLDEALAVLEEGEQGENTSPQLLNAMAVVHFTRGETKVAEDLLRRSLRIDSRQPVVQAMLRQLEASGGPPRQ